MNTAKRISEGLEKDSFTIERLKLSFNLESMRDSMAKLMTRLLCSVSTSGNLNQIKVLSDHFLNLYKYLNNGRVKALYFLVQFQRPSMQSGRAFDKMLLRSPFQVPHNGKREAQVHPSRLQMRRLLLHSHIRVPGP